MAEITFIAPVETIKGKLQNRDKTIFRRKRVFDANGHVIGQLAQEAYVVKNPRDWKKNPPKGAEKQRIDNWANACKQDFDFFENGDIVMFRAIYSRNSVDGIVTNVAHVTKMPTTLILKHLAEELNTSYDQIKNLKDNLEEL